MSNLAHYYRIVEEAISMVGIDPATARGAQPGQWNLKCGSATVLADVYQLASDGAVVFSVTSPIMRVPETGKEGFFRKLMEINQSIIGSAFSIFKEDVFLVSSRMVNGMDSNEAYQQMLTVGKFSDFYDDQLKAMFPKRQPIGFRPSYMDVEQVELKPEATQNAKNESSSE